LDALRFGEYDDAGCPNCGTSDGKKLDKAKLGALVFRFFVWGSFWRTEYGGAPTIQFNEHRETSISPSPWLQSDVALLERLLGVGFFHYAPRLWMVGEVEPLKALESTSTRGGIIDRVLDVYPERELSAPYSFYRVRKNPELPAEVHEYDSPPEPLLGSGRLDAIGAPVLYASPDLEVCLHECRAGAEDELFVATLEPTRPLRLLDLSTLVRECDGVTEFDSLDMAIHMLFLAGEHSYDISRAIAVAARDAGFDGLIYPSYFSLLRLGIMPFRTTLGLSHRLVPELQAQEESFTVPNLAVFGRPLASRVVRVSCVNRIILRRVGYDYHFGPVAC
jgi:hypothetical protein